MSAIIQDALELDQRSEEWRKARLGSLGSSRIYDSGARTKGGGYGASRGNLMAELLLERLTGRAVDHFVSAAMAAGIETEPEARAAYVFYSGHDVGEVGLFRHPRIAMTHASPDGVIGQDGLLEIKCPEPKAHLETLLAQKIPEKYVKQMTWHLACSGRQWVDYVSYNPSFPEAMRLFVKRLLRDEAAIAELEAEVEKFLAELDAKIEAINKLYGQREAA